jgi:hypothetical protein
MLRRWLGGAVVVLAALAAAAEEPAWKCVLRSRSRVEGDKSTVKPRPTRGPSLASPVEWQSDGAVTGASATGSRLGGVMAGNGLSGGRIPALITVGEAADIP